MYIKNNGNISVSFVHTVDNETVTLEPGEAIAVEDSQGTTLMRMFSQPGPTNDSGEWVQIGSIEEQEFLAMEDVATEFWTIQWNRVKSFFSFGG